MPTAASMLRRSYAFRGIKAVLVMEVIARIPELAAVSVPAAPPVETPPPEPAARASGTRLRDASSRAKRRRGPPALTIPGPSLVMLAVVAAFVWACVWRNERRHPAAADRPDRMAVEPTPSVGAERSRMP